MVILRNIKRNENLIEADYFPDGGNLFGHLVVDTISGKLVSYTDIPGISYRGALHHGKRRLLKIKDLNPLPVEEKEMWY